MSEEKTGWEHLLRIKEALEVLTDGKELNGALEVKLGDKKVEIKAEEAKYFMDVLKSIHEIINQRNLEDTLERYSTRLFLSGYTKSHIHKISNLPHYPKDETFKNLVNPKTKKINYDRLKAAVCKALKLNSDPIKEYSTQEERNFIQEKYGFLTEFMMSRFVYEKTLYFQKAQHLNNRILNYALFLFLHFDLSKELSEELAQKILNEEAPYISKTEALKIIYPEISTEEGRRIRANKDGIPKGRALPPKEYSK